MKLTDLCNMGGNVVLTLTANQLRDFAVEVVKEYERNTPKPLVFYTPKEFATKVRVSTRTLANWERDGIIVPIRSGGKILYEEGQIQEAFRKKPQMYDKVYMNLKESEQ